MGPSKSFRPHRAVPAFTTVSASAAVPPPPADIENLNLSQAFRISSSSQPPATDSAYVNFGTDVDSLETSDFVSPPNVSVNRKERNLSGPGEPKETTFKVPYRNTRPVAKVSRQETANVASRQNLDSRRSETVPQNIASGSDDADLIASDSRTASQKMPADGINVVTARTSGFQSSFTEPVGATTPYSHNTVFCSAENQHDDHIGDTPLALSGL